MRKPTTRTRHRHDGGETHHTTTDATLTLTTNQGTAIGDNQNSRKSGIMITPKSDPIKDAAGAENFPGGVLEGSPCALFDGVILLPWVKGATELAKFASPVDWVREASGHLKAIGDVAVAAPILQKTGVVSNPKMGVVAVDGKSGIDAFVPAANKHRTWDREPIVRPAS